MRHKTQSGHSVIWYRTAFGLRGLGVQIPLPRLFYSNMNKEKLSELVLARLSIAKIAIELNKGESTIRYWLKKYGLNTNAEKQPKCGCGETDPTKFYGHKKTICGMCHNQYNLQKGQEKRLFAIKTLGGKCVECGYGKYTGSLEIHHLNPETKDKHFSSMRGWTKERILSEIKNCVLLCRNCHAEVHGGILNKYIVKDKIDA